MFLLFDDRWNPSDEGQSFDYLVGDFERFQSICKALAHCTGYQRFNAFKSFDQN